MVIVITSKLRMELMDDVAKLYFGVRKKVPMPAFMKRIGPFFNTDHDLGITTLQVYELPNNKLAEGLLWAGKVTAVYTSLPGVTLNTQVWSDLAETAKTFGIALPKL